MKPNHHLLLLRVGVFLLSGVDRIYLILYQQVVKYNEVCESYKNRIKVQNFKKVINRRAFRPQLGINNAQ